MLASYSFSQTGREDQVALDSLLEVGNHFLIAGKPDSARSVYRMVLSHNWKPRMARIGLVEASIMKEDWVEGSDICGDMLDASKEDMQAHYYAGICRREEGYLKDAANHFQSVLSRDSLYRDVLYQYALVCEYDDNFDQALNLGLRQVRLHPDSVAAQIGLIRIFRHYISVTEYEEALESLRGLPDHYSEYFVGELLRRHTRYHEAAEILDRCRKTSTFFIQACCLSLARIHTELGDDSTAEALYWEGVGSITNASGSAVVFDDLKYIISDRELEQYRELPSEESRIKFFHRFWEIRNPMPTSSGNARLVEHFRRFVRAEREYEYYGNRSRFRNPDQLIRVALPRSFSLNREFNDKGMIYIRQGPPDEVQTSPRVIAAESSSPPSGPRDPNVKLIESTLAHPYESWLYHGFGATPASIFIFDCQGTTENYWTLTSVPSSAVMIQKLSLWDVRYSQLSSPEVAADVELQLRETAITGLTTDRHTWKPETKQFTVPHAIDAFRAGNGKTLLDISYAIPLEQLAEAMVDSSSWIELRVGLSIMSFSEQKTEHEWDSLRLPLTRQSKGSYISLFRKVRVRILSALPWTCVHCGIDWSEPGSS